MATYNDITARLKVLMQDVDPSPENKPVYVWEHPNDLSEIVDILLGQEPPFPSIVITRATELETTVYGYTLGDIAHNPSFDILVFLDNRLNEAEQAAIAFQKEPHWIPAVLNKLGDDQFLNGAGAGMGPRDNTNLITYRSGHLPFFEPRIFWGIAFRVEIQQVIS